MKVCILGTGDSWLQAPFTDPEWEIWGTGITGKYLPRVTRWFQLHNKPHEQGIGAEDMAAGVEWMKTAPCPVYVPRSNPLFKSKHIYPKNKVQKYFGRDFNGAVKFGYFTNSISWMIALAIMEGATEIAVYGVDLIGQEEYTRQKPSISFFLGWCGGAGIKFSLSDQSSLLKADYLYGFEYPSKEIRDQMAREMELRLLFDAATEVMENGLQ